MTLKHVANNFFKPWDKALFNQIVRDKNRTEELLNIDWHRWDPIRLDHHNTFSYSNEFCKHEFFFQHQKKLNIFLTASALDTERWWGAIVTFLVTPRKPREGGLAKRNTPTSSAHIVCLYTPARKKGWHRKGREYFHRAARPEGIINYARVRVNPSCAAQFARKAILHGSLIWIIKANCPVNNSTRHFADDLQEQHVGTSVIFH